jgi:hypothetical protein
MSVFINSAFKKMAAIGLVALTLGGAAAATATTAEARDEFWAGAAGGVVGGLIGGAIASQPRTVYVEPEYAPPPPPPRVYHRAYYAPAYPPRCHYEWVENEYGDAYRARVCPGY